MERAEKSAGPRAEPSPSSHEGSSVAPLPVLRGTLDARPYRALVVDDDPALRDLLGRVLSFQEPFDCSVRVEGSPTEAFAELTHTAVDVVLSDRVMPEEDGVSFLKRVKETHPSVIRVLITAHTDLKALLGSMVEAEVHGYVEKPIDPQLLRWTLYDLLLRRQLEVASRQDGASPAGRPASVEEILEGLRPRGPASLPAPEEPSPSARKLQQMIFEARAIALKVKERQDGGRDVRNVAALLTQLTTLLKAGRVDEADGMLTKVRAVAQAW